MGAVAAGLCHSDTHTYSNAYSHSDTHTYSNAHGDADTDSNAHCHPDTHALTYSYRWEPDLCLPGWVGLQCRRPYKTLPHSL